MAKDKEIKTNAMRILEKYKINYETHTYECEEFLDGVSVADRLGQSHEKVYKTLVAIGKSREYFVFVIPIEAELDLKKAAKAVGEKSIDMLPLKDLTEVTGYIRGGCTAIGMKKQFKTILDQTAETLPQILVSGGRRGTQIELDPKDLQKASRGEFADVIVS